ncbi:MAG: transglycosylase SLT domain-containing protein [Candidatus Competibacter sp.]|nr:transglycosylase SLT domain-containing protein [Candidatus Competibacter sp.]
MKKAIQTSVIVLSVGSLLSACAELPLVGSKWAKGDQAEQPYIDYWQTRDPSEYRQAKPLGKRVGSSKDAVLAGKTKKNAKTPHARVTLTVPAQPASGAPAGSVGPEKADGGRVSMVLPAQPGQTAPVAGPVKPNQAPLALPKAAQTKALKAPQRQASAAAPKKRKFAGPARKDLWGRVRVRSVLASVEHPRIDEQIAFLKRNPGYLNLLSQRSRPFLHYIVEQLDRRGLPTDLALVPMVESAFEPTAMSPKAAAGLWQIIPSTGQEHGLVIADGYDGRMDIHTSTGAALAYLRYLNRYFKGDWLLALAAYNAGPGAVQESIEANARAEAKAEAEAKKQAAEEAKRLAEEAKKQAEAMRLAAQQPATAPFAGPLANLPPATQSPLPPLSVTPALPAVATATSGAPAAAPAPSASGLPGRSTAFRQFAKTNPPEVAKALPVKPESVFWRLKLPKETQDYVPRILALARIVTNPEAYGLRLAMLENQPYLSRVDLAPEVKIADALALSGLSPEDFFRFNPGFKAGVEPPSRAYNLLLPSAQAQEFVAKVPGARLIAPNRYTVKKGETLAIIAKRHGVSSQALAQWNNLSVNTVLKAGQKLIVYPTS